MTFQTVDTEIYSKRVWDELPHDFTRKNISYAMFF